MGNAILRLLASRLDAITRGWFTILAGDVVRMMLGFGVSILVTRNLGPANFGIYTVLGAAVGLAGVAADFGFSEAGVKKLAPLWAEPTRQASARRVGEGFFWIRLAAAALIAATGTLLARPLAILLGLSGPAATWLLVLALLGVVASAASGAVNTLLTATGRFSQIAFLLVANTGLTLLLALLLAWSGKLTLVMALLLLGIVPTLAVFAIGWQLLPGRWSLRPPPATILRRQAASLLRFGRWMWLANILNMVAVQLDVLFLNHLGAAAMVGIYGLALSLAAKLDVVNRSLYTVLLPAASNLRTSDGFRRYLRRSLGRAALVWLLLLAAVPLSGPFIHLFYGPTFAASAPLFRLLLVSVALDVLVLPLQLLAFPLDRPRWLVALAAVRALVLFLTALPLIALFGATGAAVARIAARVAALLLILCLLLRRRRLP